MNSKRFFTRLLPLFMASALFLTGCLGYFTAEETEAPLDTYEYETYEGTLQSLGSIKFSPDATHLLRLDDGTVLYVYSDFYNLWDSEYLNQRMEVSGLLIPADDEIDKSTLAIEKLEILEVEEVVSEVVYMETYEGDMLGFFMDYRSDWVVSGATASVTFIAPEPEISDEDGAEDVPQELDTVTVTSKGNTQELEIEEWYLEYGGANALYSLSVVSQDQIPAIKVEEDNITTYYVQDVNTVYVITYTNAQEDKRVEYSNLFSEMLFSFDLMSDGIREPEVGEEVTEETEDDSDEADTTVSEIGGTDYEDIIKDLEAVLNSLIPDDGDWAATTYDFVDPDYIYVEYTDGETLGRILVRNLGGGDFELLAVFEEGSITDWSLVSGEDEASSQETTSVDAETGSTTTILEGYRALESATLHFQMQYPSNWYYSRSGDNFYFSTEPADESNALVTLAVLETSVSSNEQTSGDTLTITVPRDDDSGYQLTGKTAYSEQMQIMAESIESTS